MKKSVLISAAVCGFTLSTFASAQTYLLDMKGPGSGNPFWAAVQKGAEEAGKANNVKVVVMSPPAESDVQAQVAQIEDQIAKGVAGIALAPTDPTALASVVDKALKKGIPVVFVDTKGTNAGVSFIGTNNEVGAKMAADYICKGVAKGSEVAILQGIITQSTGKARSDGAQAGLTACGLKVVAVQPGDWDTAKGQAATENILTAHPNIKGIFASNDNMAMGAIEALRSAKKLKNVMVVGFDGTPAASKAILAGELAASVAQAPVNMGKFGIESLIKLKKGEKLDAVIDTGTVMVTKANAAQYSK
jgi:ABC-type sugar transport system substrate-binding protein